MVKKRRNKAEEGLLTKSTKIFLGFPVELKTENEVLNKVLYKNYYKALRNLQYQTRLIANRSLNMAWDYYNYELNYKNRFHEFYKEKFGEGFDKVKSLMPIHKKDVKGLSADISNILTDEFKEKNIPMYLFGNAKAVTIQSRVDKIKDKWSDIYFKGERVPNHELKNVPIEVHNVQMMNSEKKRDVTFCKEDKSYFFKIKLFSMEGVKDLNRLIAEDYTNEIDLIKKKNKKLKKEGDKLIEFEETIEFKFPSQLTIPLKVSHKDKRNTSIIDRIISYEYELGFSKIKFNEKKTKWEILLAFSFKKDESKELDKDKIMGIDMGVKNPMVIAVNEEDYSRFVGNTHEFHHMENQIKSQINRQKKKNKDEMSVIEYREMIEGKVKELSQARKWAGKGSQGRGRKCLMKPLDKYKNKIANYRNTKNHQWSKYVINEAIRLGVGTIQMEDLSGINVNDTFLKKWTYFDLQTKIENKAKEFGIEVIKIKPRYTSQRCSKCGCIDKNSRHTQEEFKCTTCGFTVNADVNASRNIAIKDIEKIIEDQLKAQEKHMKHMMKYVEC